MNHDDYDKLQAAIKDFQGEDVIGHLVDHVDVNAFSSGRTLLHLAVELDNILAVTVLLSRGAQVDCEDAKGETPLFLVKSKCTATLLLNGGANVHKRRYDGATPLHTCSGSAAALLMDRGANATLATRSGETPLHMSKCALKSAILIDHGHALVDAQNCNKYTPLHLACSFGRWAIVVALLERDASLDILDPNNRTPKDVTKAILQVFSHVKAKTTNAQDVQDLVLTIATLDIWNEGRRKKMNKGAILSSLAWHALRGVSKEPQQALADSTGLPSEIVEGIVVEWLGPWSVPL